MTCLAALLVGLAGCTVPPRLPEPPPQPPPPPPVCEYFAYCMQKGDTLYSLGRRFEVPWDEIARVNEVLQPSDLAIGKLLIIPKVPGVEVPELELPPFSHMQERPRHSTLRPEELHCGKASSPCWWPTRGRVVWRYGQTVRGLPEHGIGISAPVGTDVCAVAGGTVIACVQATSGAAWGNSVAVEHEGNMVSWYAHLGEVLVEKGRPVSKGEPIGTVGASGAIGEPCLAFRLFRNDRPVDPERYLP
ncbi:MAG: peptidoglycan DD-metalloendopeptidase family protein [Candidatus Brocadiaceae bacterium]|nr:peptidoglycan DD-metalloendopeptidase family protein [Candidatus Brocadiaceae bacterium]